MALPPNKVPGSTLTSTEFNDLVAEVAAKATTAALGSVTSDVASLTSEVSGKVDTANASPALVQATGSSTARTLSEWTARDEIATAIEAIPAPVQTPCPGVTGARAVVLRALLRNRNTSIASLAGLNPAFNDSYGAVFLRDTYHAIKPFPGYFDKIWIRQWVDYFATPAKQDSFGMPPSSCASSTGAGSTGVADAAAYFALTVTLGHRLGDSTIYSTYASRIAGYMDALPRSAGLIARNTSPPLTIGWGFDDTVTLDDFGMATALAAWACQELMTVAFDVGDYTAAEQWKARLDAFTAGLRTLRKTDGYYKPSSTEDKHSVMVTALIVSRGLCSDQERVVSSVALGADYKRGLLTQLGSIRHLRSPEYWTTSGTAHDKYQNGAYWPGEWAGWLAQAMSVTDRASGRQLLEEAVREQFREEKITGNYNGGASGTGPFEWHFGTDNTGAWSYSAGGGFLAYAVDDTPESIDLVVTGAASSSAVIAIPVGHLATQIEVIPQASATLTVNVEETPRLSNDRAESIVDVPWLFGSTALVGSTAVSSAKGGATRSGLHPGVAAIRGGWLRAKVISGSATDPVTVRVLNKPRPVPALVASSVTTDAFGSDTTANYTRAGVWTVGSGHLVAPNGSGAWQYAVQTGTVAANQFFSAKVNSANYTNRSPGLFLRWTSAPDTCIYIYFNVSQLVVVDRSAGADTPISYIVLGGSYPVNGATYTIRGTIFGSSLAVEVVEIAGSARVITTSILQSGRFGMQVLPNGNADAVYFDDFMLGPCPQPIPPGFVLDAGTPRIVGEDPSTGGSASIYDEFGNIAASGAAGTVLAY